VWNDDPRSPRYNLWTDRRTQAAGRDPEPLHVQPCFARGPALPIAEKVCREVLALPLQAAPELVVERIAAFF